MFWLSVLAGSHFLGFSHAGALELILRRLDNRNTFPSTRHYEEAFLFVALSGWPEKKTADRRRKRGCVCDEWV